MHSAAKVKNSKVKVTETLNNLFVFLNNLSRRIFGSIRWKGGRNDRADFPPVNAVERGHVKRVGGPGWCLGQQVLDWTGLKELVRAECSDYTEEAHAAGDLAAVILSL